MRAGTGAFFVSVFAVGEGLAAFWRCRSFFSRASAFSDARTAAAKVGFEGSMSLARSKAIRASDPMSRALLRRPSSNHAVDESHGFLGGHGREVSQAGRVILGKREVIYVHIV